MIGITRSVRRAIVPAARTAKISSMPLLAVAALAISAAMPSHARADYRTGNTWMATPKLASSEVAKARYEFSGGVLGAGHWTVGQVICKGDLDARYARNSRGLYHHHYCAASLVGVARYYAQFELWTTGQTTFRVSNIHYIRS
jgi:uncharacterized membrane protein